ncbi:MAG: hypothetical protein ACOX88_05645 [Christensenellales bacterium]|jgi:hypothetical protein
MNLKGGGLLPAAFCFVALAKITTGSAGEDQKSLDTRKPPFAKISAGLPTAQRAKGGFVA